MLDFSQCYYQPVSAGQRGVRLGERQLELRERIDCGAEIGALSAADLRRGLDRYVRRSRGGYQPQLAALVFFITGAASALDSYFPLVATLGEGERAEFHALAGALAGSPALGLRLVAEGRRDITSELPRDAAYLLAGQVAEVFFFRQDILGRLLAAPRYVRLYSTARAFAEDGGVAGGDYSPATASVQLLLARIYEGFYGPAPGVAPFLHEFGHMLDHLDAGRAAMGPSSGLLPGMRAGDGAIYTPKARELFLRGKRLELERYQRRSAGSAASEDTPPIGHPYVFQNDTEFIAGYFELFFRSPHAFAAMNPDLYQGFATLLRQDPRRAWAADFPFYIGQNQRFYQSGQRPSQARLSIPEQ